MIFEGMPNISGFFLWSSEKCRVYEYHVLKIRFHTRLLKPRAYGLWLNSANSSEIFHFQLLIYNILFHCISVTVQITEKLRNCQRKKLHRRLILKGSKIGITTLFLDSVQDDSRLVPADHWGSVTYHFYDNLPYKGSHLFQ
jgi:hypothetical protein